MYKLTFKQSDYADAIEAILVARDCIRKNKLYLVESDLDALFNAIDMITELRDARSNDERL